MSSSRQNPLEGLSFSKLAGGGNDFVVVDHRKERIADPSALARRVCTRALSVGADGLILIEPSETATFRMRYFNSDGSLAAFCANGTRCAARFAYLNLIAGRQMSIETGYGTVGAEAGDGTQITLSLPMPEHFQKDRPLQVGDTTVQGSSILVGVPHYVAFIRDGLWTQDITSLGRAIRNHPDLAPDGANANFVQIRDRHSIDVRTYERGVEGETFACGSGVVASVVTSAMFNRVDSPVSVLTRSGITLKVSFRHEFEFVSDLKLQGDARLVYTSAFTAETLDGFDPEFVRDPASRPEVNVGRAD
jgi:diaminopimelate epimerase